MSSISNVYRDPSNWRVNRKNPSEYFKTFKQPSQPLPPFLWQENTSQNQKFKPTFQADGFQKIRKKKDSPLSLLLSLSCLTIPYLTVPNCIILLIVSELNWTKSLRISQEIYFFLNTDYSKYFFFLSDPIFSLIFDWFHGFFSHISKNLFAPNTLSK